MLLVVATFILIVYLSTEIESLFIENGTTYLEQCDPFAVCNVIYDRYWMADFLEKMCDCPGETTNCHTMYAKPIDDHALQLNSRTQIKVCESVSENLKKCAPNQLVVTKKRVYHLDELRSEKTILHCACDDRSYWRFNHSYGDYLDQDKALIEISEDWICSELKRCQPREFCGFARSDYGFIYLRCTCPMYHKCGYDPDETDTDVEDVVQELFYSGLGYKARCMPTEEFY